MCPRLLAQENVMRNNVSATMCPRLPRPLCPRQMLRAEAKKETFVSATMCPGLPPWPP